MLLFIVYVLKKIYPLPKQRGDCKEGAFALLCAPSHITLYPIPVPQFSSLFLYPFSFILSPLSFTRWPIFDVMYKSEQYDRFVALSGVLSGLRVPNQEAPSPLCGHRLVFPVGWFFMHRELPLRSSR